MDIFSYDLSISSFDWSQWVSHVLSYHTALSSPSHPQPISRPSANPHSIVRKAIDEIIQAPAACNYDPANPQPVFTGLEERRIEKLEQEHTSTVDVLEIDLDEDGPLREEYLPKRRVSGAGSTRSTYSHAGSNAEMADASLGWEKHKIVDKTLPPPARWSPAGDEPILRDRNRLSGHYVAVQPPLLSSMAPSQFASQCYHELGYANQNWPPGPPAGYVFDVPTLHVSQPYTPYTFVPPVALPHSRSQSHSYDQDNSQSRIHSRSYSQSGSEYRYNDVHMTANELPTPWAAHGHSAYSCATGFVPHHSANYQSNWLRT